MSSGATEATGQGTLRAPMDQRHLAVRLSRGRENVWLPIHLTATGKPLRLVVPG